jgi:hypothetical protein
LFHDDHQVLSPKNESRTTPASAVEATPTNKNPIGQHQLFAQHSTLKTDNVEGDDHNLNQSLHQLYNQLLEKQRKTVTVTPDNVQCFDPASLDLLEMLLTDSKFGPVTGK